jgi:hypothetical protein
VGNPGYFFEDGLCFFGGVPILQGGDGRVLVKRSQADESAAEEEDGDDEESVAIADVVEVDAGEEKVNEEGRGEAKRPQGDTFQKEKPVLHLGKIVAYGIDGKPENLS